MNADPKRKPQKRDRIFDERARLQQEEALDDALMPALRLSRLGGLELQRPCTEGFKKFPQEFARRLVGQLAFRVEFLVSPEDQQLRLRHSVGVREFECLP